MRLGDLLVGEGKLTEKQLQVALQEQRKNGGKLGSVLVRMGLLEEDELLSYLERHYDVEAVDPSEMVIDHAILDLIPPEIAQKYEVVPISRSGKVLTVAMASPTDVFAIEDIKFSTGFEVHPVVAPEYAIRKAIDRYYQAADILSQVMREVRTDEIEVVTTEEEKEMSDLAVAAESAPVVRIVNKILVDGVTREASDIHIEPYEKEIRVRYRIDGILHEVMTPPFHMRKAIISRLKIMSKLKISEKRLPQDGRIMVKIRGRPVDLRVSSVPTIHGEKVALRVLDRSTVSFKLETLGFEEEPLNRLLSAIQNPYGIVLVTGPTGCGKTTTLYGALNRINTPEVNITTAEDPVEYSLLGVNQVQMKEQVGLSFASALRSFLRQDPNIIMVGEIRDYETAEIAIRASLTGHLVLSTVHTNTAAATITRLINMKVEPFLIASTLNLVEAQRLVRKICQNCVAPVKVAPEKLRSVGIDPKRLEGVDLLKGSGCPACNNTGYRGRTGIFEVMEVSPRIRELILDRAPSTVIEEVAVEEGMVTLRDAAILKLKRGITDLEEVIRETSASE
jgi:type IV pilus assembly protein PilB